MCAVVLAGLLLAGPEPHRGGVLQGQGAAAEESGGAYAGGIGASDGCSAFFGHPPRRRRMVLALRLRVRGSTIMNTAVYLAFMNADSVPPRVALLPTAVETDRFIARERLDTQLVLAWDGPVHLPLQVLTSLVNGR